MKRSNHLALVTVLAIALLVVAVLLAAGCTGGAPGKAPELVTSAGAAPIAAVVANDTAPPAARPYRDTLIRNARLSWGLEAPIAMFGGQVEQESGWRVDARSGAGAQGLAQVMPGTAGELGDLGLGQGVQPYNPDWALRALTTYDRQIYDRTAIATTECDRCRFMLRSYNSGEKWVRLARAKSPDPGSYDATEGVNAGQSAAAFAESRGYAPAILRRQPHYATWGPGVCL